MQAVAADGFIAVEVDAVDAVVVDPVAAQGGVVCAAVGQINPVAVLRAVGGIAFDQGVGDL